MAKSFVPSRNAPVWDAIVARLGKFSPSIDLTDYIDFKADKAVEVAGYTSEGIDFAVAEERREPLVQKLRQARTETGKKAFEEGKWKGALQVAKDAARDVASSVTGNTTGDNWALDVSMKATKGLDSGRSGIWN